MCAEGKLFGTVLSVNVKDSEIRPVGSPVAEIIPAAVENKLQAGKQEQENDGGRGVESRTPGSLPEQRRDRPAGSQAFRLDNVGNGAGSGIPDA